jgi:hypothetical protein
MLSYHAMREGAVKKAMQEGAVLSWDGRRCSLIVICMKVQSNKAMYEGEV